MELRTNVGGLLVAPIHGTLVANLRSNAILYTLYETMKLLFMGTPEFAVPCLKKLAASDHQLVGVVTRCDKPAGRGMELCPSPVKDCARGLGLPVFQFNSVNDPQSLEQLWALKPDLNIVVAYGEILKKEVLELAVRGSINLHPSLLPKYRGAAPVQHALLHGEQTTGLAVIKMDEGMDSGPIILMREESIDLADNLETLCDRLSTRGADLILEAVELIAAGKAAPKEQQGQVSLAPRIKAEDRELDLTRACSDLINCVRAFAPRPGAWLETKMGRVKVLVATAETTRSGEVGEVLEINQDGVLLACGKGALLLQEVQLAGCKKTLARDCFCGRNVKPGENILR